MTAQHSNEKPEESLDALVDAFCNEWLAGKRPDIEAYCRQHATQATELRAKINDFLFVAEGISQVEQKHGGERSQAAETEDAVSEKTEIGSPGRILGDFKIITEIGSGGMATVYEAEQISLKRKVALKLLPPALGFSRDRVTKFRREAEAAGRQLHPAIVAVYAVGEYEGVHYIAQELVEGGWTLADKLEELKQEAGQPAGYFRQVARLIVEVAEALQSAHSSGVTHRDIKPSNILLTSEGRPKITDFGLAKIEDALTLSRTGDFSGTPYYMSPEQAASRRMGIDHRTDIFSLGVTLYELLSMLPPFEGDTTQEVVKKILLVDPCNPRKKNPRVPQDLAVISLKAMEKSPDRRYQSMQEFADDLQRFLDGDVILAKPAGPGHRLWRRIKRNPVLSAAVGTSIAAVVAFIVVVPWIVATMEKEKRAVAEAARLEIERKHDEAVAARQEAELQRQSALDAQARTKAVNEFLHTMLASPNPAIDGREVKVATVLDNARAELDAAFDEQPEIEAALRCTLGRTYWVLGLLTSAEGQYRRALEIQEEIYGAEHSETLGTMADLSSVLCELNRLDEAESLIQRALEIRRRHYGEKHTGSLGLMHSLAIIQREYGNYQQAAAINRRVLEARKEILGPDAPATLASMEGLANALEMLDEFDEAESLIRAVLEGRRRELGEEHPDTLKSMDNLASLISNRGGFTEAQVLHAEVLEIRQRTLGESHPDTLDSMNNLGNVLWRRGHWSEAEELFRKVADIRSRDLGENHSKTIGTLNNLANALTSQYKMPEAESIHRRVLKIRRQHLGTEHPDTLGSLNNLATVLKIQHRFAEAEPLYRDVVELSKRIHGDGHSFTIGAINNLGSLLLDQGKISEAAAMLHECLERVKKTKLGNHWLTAMLKVNYGRALVKLQHYDESESLLLSGWQGLRNALGETNHNSVYALQNLVELYTAWGKPEKASQYRTRLPKDEEPE